MPSGIGGRAYPGRSTPLGLDEDTFKELNCALTESHQLQ